MRISERLRIEAMSRPREDSNHTAQVRRAGDIRDTSSVSPTGRAVAQPLYTSTYPTHYGDIYETGHAYSIDLSVVELLKFSNQ